MHTPEINKNYFVNKFMVKKPMRIVKLILLSLFLICAISSVNLAENEKAKLPYLCVKGVVFDAERPLAIINDKIVEEGETLRGAKILKISESSVQFEYEGEVFNREIDQDCFRIVEPSKETIYLGRTKEGFKEKIEKIIKLPTTKGIKGTEELEEFRKKFLDYFQSNPLIVIGIILLIVIGPYVYYVVTLQMIAKKTDTENGWLAWIPIANIYLECKIAGKPGWWVLLRLLPGLIPIIGSIVIIIVTIIVWMGISEARNKPAWLGILTIIPLFNLFLLGYLAFSKVESVSVQEEKEKEHSPIDIGQGGKVGE
ncbi:MAG: hypothetical protein ISS47_02760 [Candidatus Omnitrophica bacterium]|nr:hypothetical protein [Candidatus Omnitrophota bacterium]